MASYEAENLWKYPSDFTLLIPEIWASFNMWVPAQFDVEVCESGTFRFELRRRGPCTPPLVSPSRAQAVYPPLGLQSRERAGFELATSAQQLKTDRFADVT